jgi:hypothetical protein
VFNLYVRDSGAKKLYSETIAEMKPANIKFNWKILGFKEAPSEEIIQKAITETTRPAFQGIKDAVLLSIPAAVATEAATADTGVEKAKSWPIEHPWLTGAGATGAAATTKKGRDLLGKGFRTLGTPLAGLGWAGWTAYDNLKSGKGLTESVVDPLVGMELTFPSMFKENISKITKSPTLQKALGLGKFGSRVMPGVGTAITLAGLTRDSVIAINKEAKRIDAIEDPDQQAEEQEIFIRNIKGYAGGGLANLTRTVAPDSGPMSRGLSYLYNRARRK